MRRVGFVGLVLLAGLLGGTAPVSAASQSSDSEQRSFDLINDERSERGRRTLHWSSELASVAREHSEDMARNDELEHNDRLDSQVSNWTALAENVGVGQSIDGIHEAFMDSDSHRANILGRFMEVGVGVVADDGELWVTQVFRMPADQQEQEVSQPRQRQTRVRSTGQRTYRIATTLVRPSKPSAPPVREQMQTIAMLERLTADEEEPATTAPTCTGEMWRC